MAFFVLDMGSQNGNLLSIWRVQMGNFVHKGMSLNIRTFVSIWIVCMECLSTLAIYILNFFPYMV